MSWRREFVAGYVEAAQWSTSASDPAEFGALVNLDERELAPGEARRMGLRLLRWARGFAPLLDRAAELIEETDARAGQWGAWELLGHDVWLSQVGHGTGAWDRDSLYVCGICSGEVNRCKGPRCATHGVGPTVGALVTDAAKLLGECAYGWIDDDNLGHFEGFSK